MKKQSPRLLGCDYFTEASATSKQTVYSEKTYPEIREAVTENGVVVSIEDRPYPFTPEYVASFRDQADYRSDYHAAVALSAERGKKLKNLGDIRGMQKMQDLDSAQISAELAKLDELRQKLIDMKSAFSKSASSESSSESSSSESSSSEVNQNG